MFTRRIITLLALTSIACGTQGVAPVQQVEYSLIQAADSVPLHYGREVRVGDVLLQLSDVPTDSRCPQGVACVWAGDAVANLSVDHPCRPAGCAAPTFLLQLHTTLEPRAGEGWGHRVQLLSLAPVPVHGTAIDKARYVAWVRVTRP